MSSFQIIPQNATAQKQRGYSVPCTLLFYYAELQSRHIPRPFSTDTDSVARSD